MKSEKWSTCEPMSTTCIMRIWQVVLIKLYMMLSNCDSIKNFFYNKYLNVDKMLSFINERTVSRMDTLFNLACSSRPLAHTSYNLKIGAISVILTGGKKETEEEPRE